VDEYRRRDHRINAEIRRKIKAFKSQYKNIKAHKNWLQNLQRMVKVKVKGKVVPVL
jgi:hypothetical protein